jgi:predicted MFS family arabinose efflux permease
MATGIFNTGIYVGSGFGGIGGWLAEHYDWRTGFSTLAGIGLLWGGLSAVLLKDADSSSKKTEEKDVAGITPSAALSALFANRSFWLLIGVFSVVSLANWLAYGWLATYLKDRFNLSHGVAGLSATGFIPIGAFLGVLAGGVWSDHWNRSQKRARTWVAAIGIGVAAPALYAAGSSTVFSIAITSLLLFGVGRGLLDANSMPILRQMSSEKYSATGYGFLNAVGCIVGGLTTYAAGALLDANISLTIVFQCAAVGMIVIAAALAYLKPRTEL